MHYDPEAAQPVFMTSESARSLNVLWLWVAVSSLLAALAALTCLAVVVSIKDVDTLST